jgi:hypothetical protein
MKNSLRFILALAFGASLMPCWISAQHVDPSIPSLNARSSPEWLKSCVIYQVFPRSFSHEGNLKGVT